MKRAASCHASVLFGLLAGLGFSASASAQEVVVSVTHDYALGGPSSLVVIDDLARAWSVTDFEPYYFSSASPHPVNPHGFAVLDGGHIAAANAGKPWIDLMDLAGNTIDGFLVPAGDDYQGHGTIALNPSASHLLLAPGSTSPANGNRQKLWVVPTPLTSVTIATHAIDLPGQFGTAQTRAIEFEPSSGRAYVAHSAGITAIDPPYTQANIAYTIALPELPPDPSAAVGRSIALSPGGSTMLSGESSTGRPLTIVSAPFSATSTVETLAPTGMNALDGIAFVADGSRALVVDRKTATGALAGRTQMFVVSAPFGAASDVERLVFLDAYETAGHEHVAISPDGRFAVLSGAAFNPYEDLRVVRSPFTEEGYRSRRIAIRQLAPPYLKAGRGAGMAKFWPEPASTPPQLSIDRNSVTEGDEGTGTLRFKLHLSKPSPVPASIDYATVDGSAIAGSDYLATGGNVVFAPGSRDRTIEVVTFANTAVQPDRSFRVLLSNPVGAAVLAFSARDGEGLIVDDDNPQKAVIVTNPPLPDAIIGVPYLSAPFVTAHLVATPPQVPRWSIPSATINAPPGIDIDMTGGYLSGVPQRTGTYWFRIQVEGDFPQVASREYGLVVRSDVLFADAFDD